MSFAVEIIFNYMAIEPLIIWQKLMESHAGIFSPNEKAAFYNKNIRVSGVEKAIKKYGKQHFHIELANAVFQYGAVGNYNYSFLIIEKCIKKIDDANNWVKPFLDFDSFVQGRLYEKEYDFWQNASDPLEYESSGKSYANLPMKSNELPPPLEQNIIDTSQNPGRRIIRDGYVESIGSVMWIGKQFWNLTGTKKKSILKESWIKCEQLQSDVLLIKTKNSLFIRSIGSDRELQDKLRSLLFH